MCAVAAITSGAILGSQASAMASTATTAAATKAQTVKTITVPMQLVRVDAAVAKAHGYKVITVNGHQEAVKASASAKSVTPNTTVGGDCGTATIDIYNEGGKVADVYWSIHSYAALIYYDVNVAVTDSAGTGNKEYYGWLAEDYDIGSGPWVTKHSVTGVTKAKLTGYDEEWDGSVCYVAPGAIASTTVTK